MSAPIHPKHQRNANALRWPVTTTHDETPRQQRLPMARKVGKAHKLKSKPGCPEGHRRVNMPTRSPGPRNPQHARR